MTFNTGTGFTNIATDSGTAVIDPSKPNLTIVGSGDASTSATGSTITVASTGSGTLLQSKFNRGAGSTSTTSSIPYDDTPPQITEGAAFVTGSITPTKTNNFLVFCFNALVGHSNAGEKVIFALFLGGATDAVCVRAIEIPSTTAVMPLSFYYEELSSSTSSLAYQMRWGTTSGTAYMGRSGAGGLFSTTNYRTFSAQEIEF